MKIKNPNLIKAFLNETTDLTSMLEQGLTSFENDTSNLEIINEIFRASHSIKSESALMGLLEMSELAHKMEDLFHQIREGKYKPDRTDFDILFNAVNALKSYHSDLASGKEGSTDKILQITKQITLLTEKPEPRRRPEPVPERRITQRPEPEKTAYKVPFTEYEKIIIRDRTNKGAILYEIEIELKPDIPLKYARAYLIYTALKKIGTIIKTVPDINKNENDADFENFKMFFISDVKKQLIYNTIDDDEVQSLKVTKLTSDELFKEKEVTREIVTPSIRVDVDKLDALLNLIAELTTNKNIIGHLKEEVVFKLKDRILANKLSDSFERINGIVKRLQTNIMNVRMVPVQSMFNKIPPLINNLAENTGKKVDCKIQGGETLIDRIILEEMADPITHIIRNSIDHGIEPRNVRLNTGKSITGLINIFAYQTGNNVVIEIADDGRGLNYNSIREKAVELGYFRDKDFNDISENEMSELIFNPGFSTKSEVTMVSGRGVGMDIVKDKVERLNGRISISSQEGKGFKLAIILPMTISFTNVLLFRRNKYIFGIPVSYVVNSQLIKNSDLVPRNDNGKKNYYFNGIQVIDIAKLLNFDNSSSSKLMKGLTIKYFNKKRCILVDDILNEEEVVIRPKDEFLNKLHAISGLSIISSGNISYFINLDMI